jgi:hypothetical protein
MLRVVVDTNLLVSSFLNRRGAPAQVIEAWRRRRFILVLSAAIIAEIRAVLHYPHIQQKYALAEAEIEQMLQVLEMDALHVPGQVHVAGALPDDPSDEIFLACALDGEAEYIVSGDRHLLALGKFRGASIVSARQFLENVLQEGSSK